MDEPDDACPDGTLLPRPKSNFDVEHWKHAYDQCHFESDYNFNANEQSVLRMPVKLHARSTDSPQPTVNFDLASFEDDPSPSKRCNLHSSLKKSCGWPEITAGECMALGCCYLKEDTPGSGTNNQHFFNFGLL